MHRRHAEQGQYDSHDLINWLNDNRSAELEEIYKLYADCVDPEMTADQQIGKYLYEVGQQKIGERESPRRIVLPGRNRSGTCTVSVWAINATTREGLAEAESRCAATRCPEQPAEATTGDWLDRISGSLANEPAFAEVLKYGREFRESDRPAEDPAL